jgi:hypothetical protein
MVGRGRGLVEARETEQAREQTRDERVFAQDRVEKETPYKHQHDKK